MDKLQIDVIKKTIKVAIENTHNSILKFRELVKPIAPDDAIGRITRMDAINNKSVAEASLRKSEAKLKQLNYMLRNVNDPEFGLCAKCKNPIPIGRILLMPQSRFCVRCAE